jgi:NAD(P)-dependent dehydrogenase (short-subunit alcohol dehydrogenase family)
MQHTLKAAGEVILASTPLHRVGKPEEVGGTALFLASPAAAWMTGATIALDGGGLVGMSSFRDIAKL